MTIEDILEETGGFGRFQVLVVLCICLNSFTMGWSMLQMAYSGFIPDWICLSPNSSQSDNTSLQACFISNTSEVSGHDDVHCSLYHFDESPLTIVNQWHLVCGMSWIKAAVTSIQMAGVLVGVILTGRLSDIIGRKKTMYLFVLEHAVLNLVTAFSVNWQMFAACRFFIGVGIGVIIVCSFPYSLEFLPLKWRPLVSALPVWSLGIAVFALAGWLMENWSSLHIACGVLSLPGLLGYFYVPESLRWLTVHDQIKEAQEIVSKIAVVNRKLELRKASIMLQTVAWEEQKAQKNMKKHTYLDIFRDKQMARTTVIFSFHWFSLSLVYYGISFSVWSLAGNIYLNIFLLAVVEIPGIFLNFFNNKVRRKWSSLTSLAVACLAVFACVLVQYCGPNHSKTGIITGLCLTTKLGAGAAWGVVQFWGTELYPAATRGHGLLTANISARIGALVAPFLIDLDQMAVASFSVMGCLLLVDIVLCFVTPETNSSKPIAISSINIGVIRGTTTHNVDLGHDHGPGSESSTDAAESRQTVVSFDIPVTVLDTINEETSSNDTDPNSIDTSRENDLTADTEDVTFSTDTTDNEINIAKIEENISDIKKDKIPKKENKSELKTPKISKKSSPEPKPRKNKLEKCKKNGDAVQGKIKSKPKEDFPPYIESEYHKNIRYSIY